MKSPERGLLKVTHVGASESAPKFHSGSSTNAALTERVVDDFKQGEVARHDAVHSNLQH